MCRSMPLGMAAAAAQAVRELEAEAPSSGGSHHLPGVPCAEGRSGGGSASVDLRGSASVPLKRDARFLALNRLQSSDRSGALAGKDLQRVALATELDGATGEAGSAVAAARGQSAATLGPAVMLGGSGGRGSAAASGTTIGSFGGDGRRGRGGLWTAGGGVSRVVPGVLMLWAVCRG